MSVDRLSNKGFFQVLRKPLLVSFCVVLWVLFSVFSILCISSFSDCTHLQRQDTTKKRSPKSLDVNVIAPKISLTLWSSTTRRKNENSTFLDIVRSTFVSDSYYDFSSLVWVLLPLCDQHSSRLTSFRAFMTIRNLGITWLSIYFI